VLIARARSARPGWLALLPLLFWFMGYMVAIGGPGLVRMMGVGQDSFLSTDSLGIRHSAWTTYSELWLGQDWLTSLLGTGIIQSGEMNTEGYVLIDNLFIAMGLQIGLVGLLVWLGLQWQMWRYMLKTALVSRDPLAIGLTGVWATWPLSCMFNSATAFYTLLFILLICTEAATTGLASMPPARSGRVTLAA
jgi:hypothetical protein